MKSPEIYIQPSSPFDWFKYAILMAFILLVLSSQGQKLLMPGEVHHADDTSVVLSFQQFTGYYLKSKGFDRLSVKVPQLEAMNDSLITQYEATRQRYHILADNQDQIINKQATINQQLQKKLNRSRLQTRVVSVAGVLITICLIIL